MELNDAAGLLTAVAGSGALVAGIVQALKALVLPASWQHGRAPMILAAILSALAVMAAAYSLGVELLAPPSWHLAAAAWLTVYGTAIGAHQTVTKAGRIARGATDPTGPDHAA